MGLNLDLDHVAFAADRKFDGYQYRRLTAAELGQIAGRAGRHMRDGTFGVTSRVEPFEDELVEALETHRFEPVRDGAVAEPRSRLRLDRGAEGEPRPAAARRRPDQGAAGRWTSTCSTIAAAIPRSAPLATSREARDAALGRLPDPRLSQDRPGQPCRAGRDAVHASSRRDGWIPDDWFDRQVAYADRTDGDIDTLVQPHRPYPHLDLRRQPAELARRSACIGRNAPAR